MSNARELFDRCKLQLDRLNTFWSPTGMTWCYRTHVALRNTVWNDRDPTQSIAQLLRADECIRARYAEWNDSVRDDSMTQWDAVYNGVDDMLRLLRAY